MTRRVPAMGRTNAAARGARAAAKNQWWRSLAHAANLSARAGWPGFSCVHAPANGTVGRTRPRAFEAGRRGGEPALRRRTRATNPPFGGLGRDDSTLRNPTALGPFADRRAAHVAQRIFHITLRPRLRDKGTQRGCVWIGSDVSHRAAPLVGPQPLTSVVSAFSALAVPHFAIQPASARWTSRVRLSERARGRARSGVAARPPGPARTRSPPSPPPRHGTKGNRPGPLAGQWARGGWRGPDLVRNSPLPSCHHLVLHGALPPYRPAATWREPHSLRGRVAALRRDGERGRHGILPRPPHQGPARMPPSLGHREAHVQCVAAPSDPQGRARRIRGAPRL